jgi:hypothetical protein
MKKVLLLVGVTCFIALLALPAQAQKWSAEESEVWQTISEVWEMEMAGDHSWTDRLHASYQSWPYEAPFPMDKASTLHFIRAEEGHFKILAQHLAPVGIVIVGDTAVVHYFHTTVTEWDDGERETSDGRATDVLTRTKDGWRILSWVGDELAEGDDD